EAVRRVLGVDDCDIDREVALEPRQMRVDRLAPRAPDHIAAKEDIQERGRPSWRLPELEINGVEPPRPSAIATPPWPCIAGGRRVSKPRLRQGQLPRGRYRPRGLMRPNAPRSPTPYRLPRASPSAPQWIRCAGRDRRGLMRSPWPRLPPRYRARPKPGRALARALPAARHSHPTARRRWQALPAGSAWLRRPAPVSWRIRRPCRRRIAPAAAAVLPVPRRRAVRSRGR